MAETSEIDLRVERLLAARDLPPLLTLLRDGTIKPDQVFVIGGVKIRLLAAAAVDNHSELALYLVRHGADVNRRFGGGPPLLDACGWENHELIEALLAAGAAVDVKRARGDGEADDTPLMISAERRDVWAVQRLLRAGASPGTLNCHKQSAVHYALRTYRANSPRPKPEGVRIVEMLLDAGAPLTGTEIHFPLFYRDVEMTRLLLDRGSPCDALFPVNEDRGPRKGDTPLITLLSLNAEDLVGGDFGYEETDQRKVALVNLLLDRGANPNLPNHKGMTPLRVIVPKLVGHSHLRLAELLVAAGADPHFRPAGVKGKSAAEVAAEHNVTDFLELFGRAGKPAPGR